MNSSINNSINYEIQGVFPALEKHFGFQGVFPISRRRGNPERGSPEEESVRSFLFLWTNRIPVNPKIS